MHALTRTADGQAAWVLTEKLGVTWTDEVVHLACTPEAAPLALHDGTTTLACQYDPAHGALACVLTLPANASCTLQAAPTSAAAAPAGVSCRRDASDWILANAVASFAFPHTPAVRDHGDAWVIDGPLAGLRGPDGVRRCGSRLRLAKSRFMPHDRANLAAVTPALAAQEATPPVVTTAIIATGPVFCRYQYVVTLADGRGYRWQATLYTGEPLLRVAEQFDTGRDGGVELALSQDFPADVYLTLGVEAGHPERQLPLPAGAFRLGSLAPHHAQGHTAYPWLGFQQSRHPQSSFRGIGETSLFPAADVVALMGDHPWTWEYPAECTYQVATDAHGVLSATGAVARGRRTWFLFVVHRAQVQDEPAVMVGGERWPVSLFARWHRRLNDLPLDWVLGLDLDTGDEPQPAGPTAMLTPAEWQHWQQAIRPGQAPHLHAAAARYPTVRWLLTGAPEAARAAYEAARDTFELRWQGAWASGFLSNLLCAVLNRPLGPAALDYQLAAHAGVMSPAERTRLRRLILLFAHATADDALFPSHHNYLPPQHPRAIRNWTLDEHYSTLFGTPNFQTDVYYNLGLFAAVFHQHPRARAWLADSAAQCRDQLAAHFHPGGVYVECPGYFAHMFGNLLHLASVLRRQGEHDFYAEPQFQQAMLCFVDYLGAPHRSTLEPQGVSAEHPAPALQRYLPAIGDSGWDCREWQLPQMVLHAAAEVRDHAPAIADRLLAAWQACGRHLYVELHNRYYGFLYVRELERAVPPLTLATRHFVNVGVMLRADVGQPSETSLFLRSGRATHHWGFDHGHWTLTTQGSQLVPDHGYFGRAPAGGGERPFGYHTWLHNVVTFGDWSHGGYGCELRRQERLIALGEDFDYIVMDLSQSYGQHGYWRNLAPVPPVLYERHLLFAHNRYVLVWDRIEHSTVRSQLRIAALARAVDIRGNVLRFTGLDDVNLTVHVLQPGAIEMHEGLVGPQRYVLLEQDCQQDYLWLCQPLGPGEAEFAVQHTGRGVRISGVDVHGQAFCDHLAYATDDWGTAVTIGAQTWRLDGRLALHHAAAGDPGRVAVLNGARFAPA